MVQQYYSFWSSSGCKEHRNNVGETSTNVEEYVEYCERKTKARTGDNPRDIRKIKPKTFSVPGSEENDPVGACKLYAEKRPTEMNASDAPFYLAINICTKRDSSKPWFKKSAVGVKN